MKEDPIIKHLRKYVAFMVEYRKTAEYKIELEKQYIKEHEENIRSLERQINPTHEV